MIYDVIIIGGGIVGLSIAYKFKHKKVLVLEKENKLFQHQSGRNSGVIHSGIYYKPNSLKARNCVNGYNQMINFCRNNAIPFRQPGKLIIATSEKELSHLSTIYKNGLDNGLDKIELVSKDEILEIEPLCRGHRGIYVPQSGIVDYTKVGKKISSILKDTNGDILFGSEVKKITPGPIQTVILSDNNKVEGKKIIVTAGLHSDNNFGIRNLNLGVKIIPFKGEYYRLDCKDEQLNYNGTLIYPVPNPKFPFLGVHITPKMNGEIEVGPNALLSWNKENYSSSFNVKETFKILNNKALINFGIKNLNYAIQEKLNSLSPFLYKRKLSKLFNVENCELTKSRSGIRAQAMTKEGKLIEDFMIKRATNDIIFVCNAPSPAATSSFSIADEIIKYI